MPGQTHASFAEREPTRKMAPPVAPNVQPELPLSVPERPLLTHAVNHHFLTKLSIKAEKYIKFGCQ